MKRAPGLISHFQWCLSLDEDVWHIWLLVDSCVCVLQGQLAMGREEEATRIPKLASDEGGRGRGSRLARLFGERRPGIWFVFTNGLPSMNPQVQSNFTLTITHRDILTKKLCLHRKKNP